MRVGGLGVVDPAHALGLEDQLDAVLPGVVRPETVPHRLRLHPRGPGQRGRGQRVGHAVARGKGARVGDRSQLGGGLHTVGHERPVHQEILHDPHHGQPGVLRGEAHRAAALHHVRGLHEFLRTGLLGVVHAGHLGVLVHAGLVRAVVLEAAVPVHVVLGHVEHGRGQRGDRVHPVQLEARELHGQDVVLHGIAQRVQDGRAHVAHGDRLEPGGLQDRGRHPHRGGLAVGPGEAQPLRGLAPLPAVHAPRELHVPPDLDALLARRCEQRAGGPDPRGRDHEVGALPRHVRHAGHGVRSQHDVARPHDLQGVRALPVAFGVPRVHHGDQRAQLDQGVRGGEARDADPGDHHAQPRPRGVPAGQPGEPGVLQDRVVVARVHHDRVCLILVRNVCGGGVSWGARVPGGVVSAGPRCRGRHRR